MKFSSTTQSITKIKTDCLVLPIISKAPLTAVGKSIDKAENNILTAIQTNGDIAKQIGQYVLLPNTDKLAAKRLLLINAGGNRKLSLTAFKQLINAIFNAVDTTNSDDCTLILDTINVAGFNKNQLLQQAIITLNAAAYQIDTYKHKKNPFKLVQISFTAAKTQQRKQRQILQETQALISGINFTKDLANTPCNIATPTYLVEQAKLLAKHQEKMKMKILNEAELQRLNMGALLAVGQGSQQASHLIELQYQGTRKTQAPIVLVGKGVTFDTGGISIKPAAAMEDMKFDMCGAATVLGVLNAIAQQRLPINVVGLVPTVENMPGGNSFKPGDVVTSMSGKTIEIINTDAEGRLILCDALTYAKKFKPQTIIDIATLTGAMLVALGTINTGLFSRNDKLRRELLQAAKTSADHAWPMPLSDAYQTALDSKIADIKNVGGRLAGSVTAACFLERFVEQTQPWAHLDIAGTGFALGNATGATGRPVSLLVEYLRQQCGKH